MERKIVTSDAGRFHVVDFDSGLSMTLSPGAPEEQIVFVVPCDPDMPSPTLPDLLAALPPPMPDPPPNSPVTPSSLYPHLVHNALLERVKSSIIALFDKENLS